MLMHSVFDKILKFVTILKTEEATIVYAQWDKWGSYVMKHHMITIDGIFL